MIYLNSQHVRKGFKTKIGKFGNWSQIGQPPLEYGTISRIFLLFCPKSSLIQNLLSQFVKSARANTTLIGTKFPYFYVLRLYLTLLVCLSVCIGSHNDSEIYSHVSMAEIFIMGVPPPPPIVCHNLVELLPPIH